MVGWFRKNCPAVSQFLPMVQLREELDSPIDGRREIMEKGLVKWSINASHFIAFRLF
jgi:hypothetical protein